MRNGHDFPLQIAIEDQLPVSENEEIVVEMLPSTTPPTTTNLRDKRGVLEWAFEAKAGRGQGYRLCLAGALAEGQGHRDDAGRLTPDASSPASDCGQRALATPVRHSLMLQPKRALEPARHGALRRKTQHAGDLGQRPLAVLDQPQREIGTLGVENSEKLVPHSARWRWMVRRLQAKCPATRSIAQSPSGSSERTTSLTRRPIAAAARRLPRRASADSWRSADARDRDRPVEVARGDHERVDLRIEDRAGSRRSCGNICDCAAADA